MGPDNEQREVVIYFGDQRVGTLSKFDSVPTIEPKSELRL